MGGVQSVLPALVSGLVALLVAVITSRLAVAAERKRFDRKLAKEREAWARDFSAKYAQLSSESSALAEKLRQQFAHAFLYIKSPGTGLSDRRFIPSGANMIIGSDPNCDISVLNTDGTVSLRHALVQFVDGGFELHNLNSASGTFVNNVEVRRVKRLKDGDLLRFGSCEAHFILLTPSGREGEA